VVSLADGRVFTGEQAVELGLVDTLGTYEDAVQIAAEIAGIEGEPTLIRERKVRSFWESVVNEATHEVAAAAKEALNWPVMSFRFTGAE